MSTTIIFTVVSLSLLGLLLAVVLYFVAQKFKVEEDPRIDIVEALMPGANCGGCGQAGCRAFAEACTKAENLDNKDYPSFQLQYKPQQKLYNRLVRNHRNLHLA